MVRVLVMLIYQSRLKRVMMVVMLIYQSRLKRVMMMVVVIPIIMVLVMQVDTRSEERSLW